jgi:hypothetical protein
MKRKSTQSEKTKFRSSPTWKNFRREMKEECGGIDCITLSKLRPGANLHHCDLNAEHYEDISDPSHFAFLNKSTHDTVHFLYRYYVKDKYVLNRLEAILELMEKLSTITTEGKNGK